MKRIDCLEGSFSSGSCAWYWLFSCLPQMQVRPRLLSLRTGVCLSKSEIERWACRLTVISKQRKVSSTQAVSHWKWETGRVRRKR